MGDLPEKLNSGFLIITDGPPVDGTGTGSTVFNLFDGSDDLQDVIAYARSTGQPKTPLLMTKNRETYEVDLHTHMTSGIWRLGRLAYLNHLLVRPSPAALAHRVQELGIKKALIFGPGPDLIVYSASFLRRSTGLEAAIYLLDDPRPAIRASRNPVLRLLASSKLRELLQLCQKRFVISEPFRDRFEGDFGLTFGVLPPPIRDDAFEEFRSRPLERRSPDGQFRIFLGGTLAAHYHSSLRSLAKAVEHFASMTGTRCKVVVCGREPLETFYRLGFTAEQIEHLGWLESSRQVIQLESECDCLFLACVFDSGFRDFFELSFPGRSREYLMAGPPIVVHAPANSAVARYFRQQQIDFVCDSLDPAVLADSLVKIYRRSTEEQRSLRSRYLSVVERFHLATKARAQLLGASGPNQPKVAAASSG